VSLHLLQAALLELELAGRLERHPGNKVALIAELELDFSAV
jgi:predicted Rossmann fold nucleotide-binding protein DprA/Smf involved in DNA uptake